jgi:dihydroorotase
MDNCSLTITDNNYDLVVSGGRVIDPASGLDAIKDIAVKDGKIAAIEPKIIASQARKIDAHGLLVTPGLVDIHVHVYKGATFWGVDPDFIGKKGGTTTVLDAGSTGSQNYRGFKDWIVDNARIRVLGLMHLSEIGLVSYKGELNDPAFADLAGGVSAIRDMPETFIGCKIRLSGPLVGWGQQGRRHAHMAIEMAEEAGTFLMVHIGNMPIPMAELLSMLRPGDIVTHCYRAGANNLFDEFDQPSPEVRRAWDRGIRFDIGHGSGSFQYERARNAVKSNFIADSISTDLHVRNINGPVHDMPTTMAKMLDLGVPLTDVISRSTWQPAQLIGMHNSIGSLKMGREADITILRHTESETVFTDSMGNSWVGHHSLSAEHTIRCGQVL